jgi:Fic family protein
MAIRRSGDWEGWLKFFLRGVASTADEATRTAERSFELRERHRSLVGAENLGPNGLLLLSGLFDRPVINVKLAAAALNSAFPTANRLVSRFEELGLLHEMTGQRRSRVFAYRPYLALFDDSPPSADPETPVEVTENE